jgi:very-short-patch-repair endonuclease
MRSMVEGFFCLDGLPSTPASPTHVTAGGPPVAHLRLRPQGLRFRRQHPFGPYVFDFFCRSAALAIEIDGFAHGCGDGPERDARRDAWAKQNGIETMRIAAEDVRTNLEGVDPYCEIVRRKNPSTALRAVPLPVK